ncbi:putative membrane protein [Wickerhamomyces ciferrii]|uniref:Membrane protein n=1 Tax=Wickerhamomyces ciferrii (strain ATCC 14091 / BCRC 22168 / CBS 111 / JCM 3599 / NBRC 0793 / NRRL Y-1031 F-60-10) TaxID=1206466 RepID=K0KNL5_WICCF|nr:uncharacterized protein BN7_2535 [Wickerhamomyces ciferrii]CCH42989.1 putative membrane protein [Wickerhamomyces ciferrii]
MSSSLIAAFKSSTNGAADGTGVTILVKRAQGLLGKKLPSWIVDYTLGQQMAIFGDYPTSKDIAPSAIFLVVFLIFCLAHLYIFTRNMARGHKFWLSLGFAFYSFMRFLGYTLRIVWAKDILKMKSGMASEVFLIIPIVLLAGLNLILAQRIFTWRHPHLGSTKFFWFNMYLVYIVVTGVVVMAIIGQCIPYLYFLSEHRFKMCKQVMQAGSVLCVLFVSLAAVLVLAAFLIPSTSKDQTVWIYQPYWIESFSIWYFVPKNSAREAESSFKQRDSNAFGAHRIIASTHIPGPGVTRGRLNSTTATTDNDIKRINSVQQCRGENLKHNHSILIISLTTLILFISSMFRCVSCFLEHQKVSQSWIFKPVVMYIMLGLLETLVNVLYLTGRVDLRFYRPDKLSSKHRGVVGDEQSTVGNGYYNDGEKHQAVHQDHNSSESV